MQSKVFTVGPDQFDAARRAMVAEGCTVQASSTTAGQVSGSTKKFGLTFNYSFGYTYDPATKALTVAAGSYASQIFNTIQQKINQANAA